jgi:hypothetical protein
MGLGACAGSYIQDKHEVNKKEVAEMLAYLKEKQVSEASK